MVCTFSVTRWLLPGARQSTQGVKFNVTKLAIEGGPKAVTNQLRGWPQFEERAISAVTEVLKSGKVNYWTGKKGMEFEKKFA